MMRVRGSQAKTGSGDAFAYGSTDRRPRDATAAHSSSICMPQAKEIRMWSGLTLNPEPGTTATQSTLRISRILRRVVVLDLKGTHRRSVNRAKA